MRCLFCNASVELAFKRGVYVHSKDKSFETHRCSCGFKGEVESGSGGLFPVKPGQCPNCLVMDLRLDHPTLAITENKINRNAASLPVGFIPPKFNNAESRDLAQYDVLRVVLDFGNNSSGLRSHLCTNDPRYHQLGDLFNECLPSWNGKETQRAGIAGLLTGVHILKSARGNAYVRATLTDMDYSLTVLIWPKCYDDCWPWVSEFSPVVVHGKWQTHEGVKDDEYTGWDNMELHIDQLAPYKYRFAGTVDNK